jgi:hypothetical protein
VALILGLLLVVPDEAALFPASPSNEADRALQEEVELLLARPVDLNRATVEDLLAIPWLDPFLAHAIVRTRDSLGPYRDLAGLRFVPGLTDDAIAALAPVVTVRPTTRPWTASVLVRSSADSLAGPAERPALLARAQVKSGKWQGTGIVEKDRGEPDWFDFAGGGLQFRSNRLAVVLGDLAVGAGRGLVLTSPSRRSSSWLGAEAWTKGRLAVSTTEGAGLRGVGLETRLGMLDMAGWASASARDARLNEDGTVDRISTDGRHDDSAAQAEKGVLNERSAGAVVQCRWKSVQLGASGMCVAYDRPFVPRDSAGAFHGRTLAVGSLNAEWLTRGYLLGAELAAASSRALAGALEVSGNWSGVTAGVNLRGRGPRYFAPHGRWSSMTGVKERFDASVRLGYRAHGFSFACRGNTYRDFRLDSLPAQLAADVGQRIGRVHVELGLARSFRQAEERYRSSRLRLTVEPAARSRFAVVFADEQPEQGPGRGMACAVTGSGRWRLCSIGLSAARFNITGPGIAMSAAEPGVMRIGTSFRTTRSAWRSSGSAGLDLCDRGRLGLKFGCTWTERLSFDAAVQLELAVSGD